MALINQNVSALTNGVSQQPDIVRLDSQATEQLNGISNVIDGVGPRPPSEIVADVTGSPFAWSAGATDRSKLSVVTDDDGEDYVVCINSGGDLAMFKASDGSPQTVNLGAGASAYLASTNPAEDISLTTAGSTLFLLNRDKIPAYRTGSAYQSPAISDYAVVWIKQGRTDYSYEIRVTNYKFPPVFPQTDFLLVPGSYYALQYIYPGYINSPSHSKLRPADAGYSTPSNQGTNYNWVANYEWVNTRADINGTGILLDPVTATGLGHPWEDITSPLTSWPEERNVLPGSGLDNVYTSGLFASVSRRRIAAGQNTSFTEISAGEAAKALAHYFNAMCNLWMLSADQGTSNTSNTTTPGEAGSQLGIWRAAANGDVIILYKREDSTNVTSGDDYATILGDSSYAGKGAEDVTWFASESTAGYAVNHKRTDSLDDLPSRGAPDGFKIAVTGAADSGEDDWYVQYSEADGWKEVPAPGLAVSLDPETMPFVLEKTGASTWSLGAGNWNDRTAGDELTAPGPSFVGKKITDIAVHKNRLVLSTNNTIVFSRVGELLNFFAESARDVLDTDPIDIEISNAGSERAIDIFSMVSLNQFLIGFGTTGQVVISGADDSYTPSTVGADVSSYYDVSPKVDPVVIGNRAYFAGDDTGAYSSIFEYGQTRSQEFVGADITGQVPRYIPSGVDILTGSLDENTLVCGVSGADNQNKLFIYRQYFSKDAKAQSSWSRWEFADDIKILAAKFRGDDLYLLTQHPASWMQSGSDNVFLEKLRLDQRPVEPGNIEYNIRLDHRQKYEVSTLTTTFDPSTNLTRIQVPLELADSGAALVIGGTKPGVVVDPVPSDTTAGTEYVYVPGTLSNSDNVYFGRKYPFEYTLSKLFYKRETRGGVTPVTTGRLQLKRMRVGIKDAGLLRVIITPQGRPQFERVFTPRELDVNTQTDQAFIQGFELFDFDIGCDASTTEIKFVNDFVTPGTLINYEWFANYFDKYTGRGGR